MEKENIRVNYTLACDQVIVDINGKISIIGIFNKINAKSTPAVHTRFTITTNIMGHPGTYYTEKNRNY